MMIFLICPVRQGDINEQAREEQRKITEYVKSLEGGGHEVHWPMRDTDQSDLTGGYQICRANLQAMLYADEIHIWYDEKSQGSKFDMGVVFVLVRLGLKKKIVIANLEAAEALDEKDKKSFLKVMKHLAG